MRAPRPLLDAPAPDRGDRRHDARDGGAPQTRARRIGRGIAIGLCALACVVALALHTERVSAANLSVTNCLDDGSAGSLRVVVGAAGSGDIIGFNQDCTGAGAITLGSTLTLTQNVTIDGVGHSVTVQAAATPHTATYRVFTINSGVVSISNLTIANGNATSGVGVGGGILNGGTLTVTNSTLSGNSATFNGGGIANLSGTLTVTNSIFSGNTAGSGPSFGDGGAIQNNGGTANVTGSTFSGNSASFGGGIANERGTLTMAVTSSTFTGNFSTSQRGGGIANFGTMTVTSSTFTANNSLGGVGGGGGIENEGTLTVTNSTLSSNTTGNGFGGGGILNYNSTGKMTVTNTTLSGNTATGNGGGIASNGGTMTVTNSTLSSNSGFNGGGIFIDSGTVTVTVTNCTIANNTITSGASGGGIYNDGPLMVTNSTFSGNRGGDGSGIYSDVDGSLTVTNSTFSGNGAPNSFGGGIFNDSPLTVTNSTFSGNTADSGGGIYINAQFASHTVNLTNTIVAGNTATGAGPDINGAVTTTDHNLIGTTSGTTGITNGTHGDIVNPMPNLDTLKDNGGTTPLPDGSHVMTRALLTGSPAIGAGDSSVCNSTTVPATAPVGGKDQRGLPRPPTTCAIGAFEPQVATVTITLSPATLPTGTVGIAYSQTLTASGGTAPYTFTVTTGSLPTGLTLATTGALSGTPSATGTFTFTVTATDATGFTGTRQYTLTIAAAGPTLTGITLTGPGGTLPATLKVGQRVQLTATGTYSDGSTRDLTTQVQWSSSNAAIATVNAAGIVTGQSPGGPATITATLNGVSGTTTVSVTPPTPLGIQPAPAPAARPAGAASSVPPSAPGTSAVPAPAPLPLGR